MFRIIAAAGIAYLLRDTPLFPYAIALAVVTFITYGIASNFRQDPDNMPLIAAMGSTLAPAASVVLLIVSVVL